MKKYFSVLFSFLLLAGFSPELVSAASPLKLIATSPPNAKRCANAEKKIVAVFNNPIDATTLFPTALTVKGPDGLERSGSVTVEDASNFTRDLSFGSSGDDVRRLQQDLFDAGFLKAPPNGYFGFQTKDAVMAWQKAVGIDATGSFGPTSRERLSLVIFTPAKSLEPNTVFIAAVTSNLKDRQGNALPNAVGWSFATGPNCSAVAPPDQKSAVVASDATVTPSSSATAIEGDEFKVFDVKFQQLNIGGGPRCTSDRTAITATFSYHVDGKTLTTDNVLVLGPDELPVTGKATYLHLHKLKKGLSMGSEGDDVKKLQVFLHTLGFFSRAVPTGKFGGETRQALMAWQKSIGIKQTGVYDGSSINNAHVFVFQPTVPLEEDSVYSMVATTGVHDILGHSLPRVYKRNFVTGPDCQSGQIGTRGPRGFQGIQGIQGIEGIAGPSGPQGEQGATGTQGPPGPAGPPGPQGPPGQSGASANGSSGGQGVLPYATILDSTDQYPASTNVGQPIVFNTTEEAYLVDHSTSSDTSRIYFQQSGVYRITSSGMASGAGNVYLWLRKNGVDVPNSSMVMTSPGGFMCMVMLYNVNLVPGDYVEFMFTSDSSSTGFKALPPQTEPASPGMPSFMVNIIRVSDLP